MHILICQPNHINSQIILVVISCVITSSQLLISFMHDYTGCTVKISFLPNPQKRFGPSEKAWKCIQCPRNEFRFLQNL